MSRWFAIARSAEVPGRHVGHYQLQDQELAVWRSDSGAINAWENRCPHRGVRLTLGTCEGNELRCQYHAWRFASGDGQCTHIPAHPAQKPASTIRPRVFAVMEQDGFIWVNLTNAASPPPRGIDRAADTLRSLFMEAPLEIVRETLLEGYPAEAGAPPAAVRRVDDFTLNAGTSGDGTDLAPLVTFLLQPVSGTRTVVHGVLHVAVAEQARLPRLRHHDGALSAVRDEAERRAARTTGAAS